MRLYVIKKKGSEKEEWSVSRIEAQTDDIKPVYPLWRRAPAAKPNA